MSTYPVWGPRDWRVSRTWYLLRFYPDGGSERDTDRWHSWEFMLCPETRVTRGKSPPPQTTWLLIHSVKGLTTESLPLTLFHTTVTRQRVGSTKFKFCVQRAKIHHNKTISQGRPWKGIIESLTSKAKGIEGLKFLSVKMRPVLSSILASKPVCFPITLISSVTGWWYKGKIADLISIIWISKWGLINYGSHLLSSRKPAVGKFTDSSNATFLEAISKSIASDSNLDAHFLLPPFLSGRGSLTTRRESPHLGTQSLSLHRTRGRAWAPHHLQWLARWLWPVWGLEFLGSLC